MAFDDPLPTRDLPPAAAPPPAAGSVGPSRRLVLLSLLSAAVAGALVGSVATFTGDGSGGDDPGDAPAANATPAPIEPVSVESFDPVVDGSGLRPEGDDAWETQTYTTAAFGGLKPGVGLVLDLGEAREVTSVTLPTATTGLEVELLAGDEAPSGGVDALTEADQATTGAGATELSGADAGAHRYWMVWVTQLAATEGGFSATIGTPRVLGPASSTAPGN